MRKEFVDAKQAAARLLRELELVPREFDWKMSPGRLAKFMIVLHEMAISDNDEALLEAIKGIKREKEIH